MATSESSGGEASQLPKPEAVTTSVKISNKLPRRQLTLISLTICLNVLLWTSLLTLVATLYLFASNPNDTNNIPTEILTILSALASVGYIIVHTIFSLKQRIWRHQRRHPSIVKKTAYVAVRIAGTLCILWLLTNGWNMIMVARRPVCLPEAPGLAAWESGMTCMIGRIGFALSFVALVASCTLFGMLAVLRRPFEVHVFKATHHDSVNSQPTPTPSRKPSPTRSTSNTSERLHSRYRPHRRRSSVSTTDVETLDPSSTSLPTTIHAPSPVRTIGLGIFTFSAQPPPLPAPYNASASASTSASRSSSTETTIVTPPPPLLPSLLPPTLQPTSAPAPTAGPTPPHPTTLPPPPRMSTLIAPSGFVPLTVPVQFSHSAWRAVHPTLPSPLGPASRSTPYLPQRLSVSAGSTSFPYRNRYSRSSVSLTKPHRLSSATPAGSMSTSRAGSERSGSTGPGDERRASPESSSGITEGGENGKRASAAEIAYAILNGTHIPGLEVAPARVLHSASGGGYKPGHMRHASAPYPSSVVAGAEMVRGRMAMGWKPRLRSDGESINGEMKVGKKSGKGIVRSSSAELLSRFSPDSSPDGKDVDLRVELERELDARLGGRAQSSSSGSSSGSGKGEEEEAQGGARASTDEEEVGCKEKRQSKKSEKRRSRMPQPPRILKRASRGEGIQTITGGDWEEVKNKPLPEVEIR